MLYKHYSIFNNISFCYAKPYQQLKKIQNSYFTISYNGLVNIRARKYINNQYGNLILFRIDK